MEKKERNTYIIKYNHIRDLNNIKNKLERLGYECEIRKDKKYGRVLVTEDFIIHPPPQKISETEDWLSDD